MSEEPELMSLAKMLLTPALLAAAASTMTMQYGLAALIVAAAERGAIDPARVFQLLGVLADGFDLSPDVETAKMTATMLRGVEQTYRNLTALPAGAGHA